MLRFRKVFMRAPRALGQIFEQAMALGDRPMVVHGELCLSYGEVFAGPLPCPGD